MFEKHTTEGKIFTKHKASYHMALKTIKSHTEPFLTLWCF